MYWIQPRRNLLAAEYPEPIRKGKGKRKIGHTNAKVAAKVNSLLYKLNLSCSYNLYLQTP